MLYGRAAQPPARNARLAGFDQARAAGAPGLVQVVSDPERGFVGVVCETPGAVAPALEALDVWWELPAAFDQFRNPFVATDIIRLVILISFPIIALWLPGKMG